MSLLPLPVTFHSRLRLISASAGSGFHCPLVNPSNNCFLPAPRLCSILGRASLNNHKSNSLHFLNTSLKLSLGTGLAKSQWLALGLRLLFIIPPGIIFCWLVSSSLSVLISRLWGQDSSFDLLNWNPGP